MSTAGLARKSWAYVNGPVPRLLSMDVLLGGIAMLLTAIIGSGLGGFQLYVLTTVIIYAIVGASHTILFGAAGQPSVGHAAFLGAGAYAAAYIAERTSAGLVAEIPIALVIGCVVGLLMGLPSLRIGGLYLAIATLAVGSVGGQIFFQWKAVTGGGAGKGVQGVYVLGNSLNLVQFLDACVIVAAVLLLIARNALRGRIGLGWNALRTNQAAATTVGVAVGRYKAMCFVLSGAMTCVAGVLYVHAVNYISPDEFDVNLSILTLVVAIVGGQRSLWGAAMGSAFIMGLPEFLRELHQYRLLVFGLVFVLVMIFFPEGFVGFFRLLWRRFVAPTVLRRLPTALVVDRGNPMALVDDEPGRAKTLSRTHSHREVAEGHGVGLVLDQVRVAYGGVVAVAGATLRIEPGEVVGLVGPNGAGKSTLLNAISGLATIASGTVVLNGHDLTRRPARTRATYGVGRTFQNLSLHSGLTVLEHAMLGQHTDRPYGITSQLLRLPSFSRGQSWMLGRAWDVLASLELTQFAHDEVDNMPYGMQKRVDVARAIVAQPTLLLLDEPAAGLTPQEADEIIDVVLALSAQVGATVVMVEHNIDLVMRVARRVVALDSGHIIADDVPQAVRSSEEFVRSYIGV